MSSRTYLDLPPSARYASDRGEEPMKTFRKLALDCVREMLENKQDCAVDVVERALRGAAARARETEAELAERLVARLRGAPPNDPGRRIVLALAEGLRIRAKEVREKGREDRWPAETEEGGPS